MSGGFFIFRRLMHTPKKGVCILKTKATGLSHLKLIPPDIQVENHFSLFLIRPLSDRARAWIQRFVQPDALYFGSALVVEPRFVGDLIEGMVTSGLTLDCERGRMQ